MEKSEESRLGIPDNALVFDATIYKNINIPHALTSVMFILNGTFMSILAKTVFLCYHKNGDEI